MAAKQGEWRRVDACIVMCKQPLYEKAGFVPLRFLDMYYDRDLKEFFEAVGVETRPNNAQLADVLEMVVRSSH